jgi:hypothetical protein
VGVADVADEVAARQDSYQSAVSDHRQASDPPRQHGLGGGLQRGDLIGGNDGAGHHVIDGLTGLAEHVGLRDDAEDVLLIVHDRHTGDAVVDDDSHGLVDAVARVTTTTLAIITSATVVAAWSTVGWLSGVRAE